MSMICADARAYVLTFIAIILLGVKPHRIKQLL